jgi:hypothetical protein
MNPRALRRAPAPFASDQLVPAVRQGTDDDRLENALHPQGSGELIQAGLVECLPRLPRVRPDFADLEAEFGGS